MPPKKNYVIDTNVILHDCQSILKFQDNDVFLPITVLEEIDHFKKDMNELGRNARHFSRMLDDLREKGSLTEGVPVNDEGGLLTVAFYTTSAGDLLNDHFDMDVPDNRILAVALQISQKSSNRTVLVTQDTNLRIKADVMGLPAETYETDAVDFDSLYTGVKNVDVPAAFLKQLRTDGAIPVTALPKGTPSPFPNEILICAKGQDSEACRYIQSSGLLQLVPNESKPWDLEARNDEQHYALDLLLDDDIKVVTIVGKAGTGKTLLALAAGLSKTTDEFVYRTVSVSRPVFPMGKDIGFLPGDIEDKLAPYMQPIVDNIEFLMCGYAITEIPTAHKPSTKIAQFKKKQGTGRTNRHDSRDAADDVEQEKMVGRFNKGYLELVNAGIIELEPLLYIRGRSVPKTYLIVDEAQNLTPHEVKTIITRAGEGTKIILTGDPYQIDNPYVDASSNGLSYVVERFKNEAIAGHITLTKGERSELAEIASCLL